MENWSLRKTHPFYFLMRGDVAYECHLPLIPGASTFPCVSEAQLHERAPFWVTSVCVFYFYDIVSPWSFRTSQKVQLFVESGEEGLQIWTVKNLISNFEKDASVFLFPTSVFGLNAELEEKGCITHGLGDLSGYLWPSVGSIHRKHPMTSQCCCSRAPSSRASTW